MVLWGMSDPNDLDEKVEVLEGLSRLKRVVVPRNDRFTRAEVVQAFASAFQMIGGVPRLALWANENPTEFYRLYGKLMPSSQVLHISPPVEGQSRRLSTEELLQIVQENQEEAENGITFGESDATCH
jgi:hypothetical protein